MPSASSKSGSSTQVVGSSIGLTLPLDHFAFARVDCWIVRKVGEDDDKAACYEECRDFVLRKIASEVEAIRQKVNEPIQFEGEQRGGETEEKNERRSQL